MSALQVPVHMQLLSHADPYSSNALTLGHWSNARNGYKPIVGLQ